MSSLPLRANVREFKPYTPGLSIEEIRMRYGLSRVIKMASNENPLGISPLVEQALHRHATSVFRYPQPGNPRLVQALAEYHRVSPSRIVVGNGSDELIDLLFRVCAEPSVHNAVAFCPCFGIYVTQAALCGVNLRQIGLNPDFSFPWEGMRTLIDNKTALVFITSPDNPSGHAASVSELVSFARSLPETCLLVIDEAYIHFADNENAYSLLSHVEEFPNVAISRTFSKLFGLAGLRLGYMILPPLIAEHLWRVRLPFSVNLLSEEAGLAALQDRVFCETTRNTVQTGRAWLAQELTKLGFTVIPSQANFLMFKAQPRITDSTVLFERLLQHGIILRPLASYGLPQYLRVSIGTEEENHILISVLKTLLAQ